MAWWVMVPAAKPNEDPNSPDAQIIQTNSSNDPGTVTLGGQPYIRRAGPFKTQADAQKAAPVSGISFIGTVIGAVVGAGGATASGNGATAGSAAASGASAGASSVATFGSIENALSAFYDKLTDGKMWRSLGWLALGILLMLLGLAMWIGPSAMRRSPLGMAREALG
jgi:hypothetical protein